MTKKTTNTKTSSVHNITNHAVPHSIQSIGHLGRNFTLDDPSFSNWKQNLTKSKTTLKRNITRFFKKLYKDKDTKLLKPAYQHLDYNIEAYISKNAQKLLFDRNYFKKRQNTSANVRRTLPNIKNAIKTMVEVDKSMGDCYIYQSQIDDAADDILSGPNFEAVHESEAYISEQSFRITKKLVKQHESCFIQEYESNHIYSNWIRFMRKTEETKQWIELPNLRPMIKLHKKTIEWRRVLNCKVTYATFISKYLQIQLDLMLSVLMDKTNTPIILENGFELINNYHTINNSETSYDNNERLPITYDVKALYDSLNLEQSKEVLEYLNEEFLNWNPWIFEFLIEIIHYFKNNTFIKYKQIIKKMIDGIGTGFSHSGSLANIVLLGYEIKNKQIFFKSINIFKDCIILLWKRYIDDGIMIIDVNKDIFDSNCDFGKFLSTIKRSLKKLYPENIELEIKIKKDFIFLDTHSHIDDKSQNIITSIYEKPLNKHQTLHWNSNNSFEQKKAIFQSQLYRGICLNDVPNDYITFRKTFINRMIKRGYHQAVIRKILSSNMPKYHRRREYLDKLAANRMKSFSQKLLLGHSYMSSQSQYLTTNIIEQITSKFISPENDNEEEEKSNTIFFIKTYQQLFDDDNHFRKILKETLNLLPFEESDNLEIKLANRAGTKIRLFLN